jgi:hypothetical protein
MRRRDKSCQKFSSKVALALAMVSLLGCSQATYHAHMRETFTVGEFHLYVESVTAEDRRHQGVPLDVEIRLSCDGGNRFDRMDLAEALNKKGRVYFRANGGYRERLYLFTAGEDARELVTHAYPPPGSQGYVLRLGNPYGQHEQIEADLGR